MKLKNYHPLVGIGLLSVLIMVNIQSTQQEIQKKVAQQEHQLKRKTKHLPTKAESPQTEPKKIKNTPTQNNSELGSNFNPKAKKRRVSITNGITKKMLQYSHFTGKYNPEFKLSVNGQPLAEGESMEIETDAGTIPVKYNYSFAGGYKKGEKTVPCKVDPTQEQCTVYFSWKDKDRVTLK